ncbi:hypothetical protein FKM82_007491 [Ascaphus truei]
MKSLSLLVCCLLIALSNAQFWGWGGNSGGPNNYPGGGGPGGGNHGGGGGPGSGGNTGYPGSGGGGGSSAKLVCTDSRGNGATAKCQRGYTLVSCSCGKSCGSWNVQDGNTCNCQCKDMDWASARCCKV